MGNVETNMSNARLLSHRALIYSFCSKMMVFYEQDLVITFFVLLFVVILSAFINILKQHLPKCPPPQTPPDLMIITHIVSVTKNISCGK